MCWSLLQARRVYASQDSEEEDEGEPVPEVVHVSKRGRTVKLPSKYLPEVGVLCILLAEGLHNNGTIWLQKLAKGAWDLTWELLPVVVRSLWGPTCMSVCLSHQSFAAVRHQECHAGQHVPQAQQLWPVVSIGYHQDML